MYKKITTLFVLPIIISITYFVILMMMLMYLLLQGYYIFYPHSIQQIEIFTYVLQHQHMGLFNSDYLNVAERRHLLDVKYLMTALKQNLFYAVIASVVISFLLKQWLNFSTILQNCAYLGLGSIGVIMILLLNSNFMMLFNAFHTLFFLGNTWLFPKNSKLTQLFPLEYFYNFSFLYITLLTLLLISIIVLKYIKNK
jgi:uncharacterized membrane protein